MLPDDDACYRALLARDARFDGRLFVAVRTTGVYCRPICPAPTPKRAHCTFHPSAAAAQAAGYRPCLRCRPECAPSGGAWRGTSGTVSRAMSLIERGALDGRDVASLAARVGVGDRQLRRLFARHVGATPQEVATTRRVLFAKQLLHETRMPMAQVAYASGFGSVRRFNEVFRALYGRPPSELRRRRASRALEPVTLRLGYRGGYEWDAMLRWFARRALPGVERVRDEGYERRLRLGASMGWVRVTLGDGHLVARIELDDLGALPALVTRIRHVFDLDADVETIESHLAQLPVLAGRIARRPSLRVPGAWDGFEAAIRAVLGQQVSVEAGRAMTERLVRLAGRAPEQSDGDGWLFPTPEEVAAADLSALRMPGARRRALHEVARAAMADPTLFEPAAHLDATLAKLTAIRGVGPWTASMIALRAAREPDAWPTSDVGLLRALETEGEGRSGRPTPAAAERAVEPLRPFRAYAAQHLWTCDEDRP